MKLYPKDNPPITVKACIGEGVYRGAQFMVSVPANAAGHPIGLPMIEWENGNEVIIQIEDIIPRAYGVAYKDEH